MPAAAHPLPVEGTSEALITVVELMSTHQWPKDLDLDGRPTECVATGLSRASVNIGGTIDIDRKPPGSARCCLLKDVSDG